MWSALVKGKYRFPLCPTHVVSIYYKDCLYYTRQCHYNSGNVYIHCVFTTVSVHVFITHYTLKAIYYCPIIMLILILLLLLLIVVVIIITINTFNNDACAFDSVLRALSYIHELKYYIIFTIVQFFFLDLCSISVWKVHDDSDTWW